MSIRGTRLWMAAVLAAVPILLPAAARAREAANDNASARIEELERTVRRLSERVDGMGGAGPSGAGSSGESRFHFGGYGEIHANFGEGKAPDQIDIHRFVAYLGYDFADWIRFHSETEIEHAFVSPGESDGEISIEQAYIDFLLSDRANVRFGRFLTPIGIINRKHEPPSFNGVERPAFDTFIIPTTWSSDGIGIFGSAVPALKYEFAVAGGLDGSKFDAVNGIREGRIEESPSLNDPAFVARLDYYPFAANSAGYGQMLRAGVTGYYSGLNNGNKGENPEIRGDVRIVEADAEYTISKLDVRGEIAYERIHGAKEIGNGTARAIFGWLLEGGYHVFPAGWKAGRLSRADAVIFARYEVFNTQFRMPDGVEKNPAGDRTQWTAGVNFHLTPAFVVKADFQVPDDKTENGLPKLLNFGVGWQF